MQKEERIDELYAHLLRAREAGEWTLIAYSEEAAFQERLRDELSSRVRLFGLTPAQMRADPRFSLYYPWLMNA